MGITEYKHELDLITITLALKRITKPQFAKMLRTSYVVVYNIFAGITPASRDIINRMLSALGLTAQDVENYKMFKTNLEKTNRGIEGNE